MHKKLRLSVILVLSCASLFAQDKDPKSPPVDESYAKAIKAYKAGMAELEFLKGEWQAEASMFNSETQDWDAQPVKSDSGSTVRVVPLERIKGLSLTIPGATEYLGVISYDIFQKTYRMVFNDSALGLLDVYEGHFENGALIMTNLKSGTSFKSEDQNYFGRLTFKPITGSGWSLFVELSLDEGNTWSLAYKLFTSPVS